MKYPWLLKNPCSFFRKLDKIENSSESIVGGISNMADQHQLDSSFIEKKISINS